MRAAYHSFSFSKYPEDVFAFSIFKVGIQFTGRLIKEFEFGERGAQDWSLREDHGTFHQVFEFSYVARPVPITQHLHRCRRYRRNLPVHPPGVLVDKIIDEDGDVFTTLSKRRDFDREDL